MVSSLDLAVDPNESVPLVKMCEITTVHDAVLAAKTGAKFIGMIFMAQIKEIGVTKCCKRNFKGGKAGLDQLWLNILLAMIGEQFDEGDEICGAVASVRARQEKVALWTRTATHEAAQFHSSARTSNALNDSSASVFVQYQV
jgi:hypothetical protein